MKAKIANHSATEVSKGRGIAATLLLALLTLALALALTATPASALIHRGHVFSFSFGQGGSAPGQLDKPTAIAVSEASGELYVVDSANERVEVFAPDGAGGYAFDSEFKVRSPIAIAVDNASGGTDATRGNVYVVGSNEKEAEATEHEVIYEYDPTAKEVVHKWTIFKTKIEKETEELELEDISGVAVDQNGILWVYWEEEGVIDGFSKQAFKNENPRLVWEPALKRTPEIEFKFECSTKPGFAVAPAADAFYTPYERQNAKEECPGQDSEGVAGPTAVAKFDGASPLPNLLSAELIAGQTTGVAVDSSNGDVYLNNASSIAAVTASGLPIQRFGQGNLSAAAGMAVDAQRSQLFVTEPAQNKISVFSAEGPGAPVIDSVSSQAISPSQTQLKAQIDPKGTEVQYHFQYGTGDCGANPADCTDTPTATLPASYGDTEVHVTLQGLSPATAYHYRLLIQSSAGQGEGSAQPNSFTTLPSPSVMPDGRGWEMVSPPQKRGAAVELISRFRGGELRASEDGSALVWLATAPLVAEPEGNRSLEMTQLLSRRSGEAWSTDSLETPHEQGRGLLIPSPTEYHFFSPDLSQALLQPTDPRGRFETPPLSPDASEKTMYVRSTPPAPAQFDPLVTAANDTAATQFGGQLEFLNASSDLKHVIFESKVGLTAAAPSAGGLYEWQAGAPLTLISVLPDGSPAPAFESLVPTLGNAGGLNSRNAISENGTRVFWTAADEKHLYLRDTTTNETILINAAQGHGSTEAGPGEQEVPEPGQEGQEVSFQSASADGSKVFFTDTARLSEDSSLEPGGEEPPADLYQLSLQSAPGQPLKARLSDLTAQSSVAHADVLNLIPGASADGTRVYFVANGVLAPGASPGRCERNTEAEVPSPADATCNLYVSEADPAHPGSAQTRFIAALSAKDAADWGAGESVNLLPRHANLATVTSRVSSNGRYLAFMSERPLTGYDNRDAQSGVPDEEVYLYDAQSFRLLCASCNSKGSEFQRPLGVFDTEDAGEGVGLLIDRPELWHERWLAGSVPGWSFNFPSTRPLALYQARYLSDQGRLYFNSADALVASDSNAKSDVYQYEPDGLGDCHQSGGCVGLISSGTGDSSSAFLDASQSGDDVFFMTSERLVATDNDNAFDIYDAHLCSSESPCIKAVLPPNEDCASADGCRGSSPPPPQSQPPASQTFSGPGNSPHQAVADNKTNTKPKPPTRAQKLAKALAACKKLKTKHKRAVCRAQAKKRYGPVVKSKAKKKAAKKTAAAGRGR